MLSWQGRPGDACGTRLSAPESSQNMFLERPGRAARTLCGRAVLPLRSHPRGMQRPGLLIGVLGRVGEVISGVAPIPGIPLVRRVCQEYAHCACIMPGISSTVLNTALKSSPGQVFPQDPSSDIPGMGGLDQGIPGMGEPVRPSRVAGGTGATAMIRRLSGQDQAAGPGAPVWRGPPGRAGGAAPHRSTARHRSGNAALR